MTANRKSSPLDRINGLSGAQYELLHVTVSVWRRTVESITLQTL